ncbi:uncharacterized protein LOC130917480 isoform X2 [Corythoichthys intestinalis]|uniref:uncharacterized protein LOC130917480 isoform X2 n=1 Tax=Corythoichthys intestinalis TaxID=161448 RepID=UPI0025A67E55|nr:uncharacterized protein LOC130917480 isoform X2 [Corythoichthys intestinalis]
MSNHPAVLLISIEPEEDVLQEAMKDGFLVEDSSPSPLKSESLQENTTTQQFNQTSSDRDDSHIQSLLKETMEGSASGDWPFQPWDNGYSTTSEKDLSGSDSTTTSLSDTNVTQSSITTELSVPSQTDDSEDFYSGSGNGDILDQYFTTPPSMNYTEGDVAKTPLIYTRQNGKEEAPGMPMKKGRAMIFELPSVQETDSAPTEEQHKGHVTPDWIIILGFVVGVAALVMLCAAIATRDKWNGPRQALSLQTKVEYPQQQKDENEVFLEKDAPKENGKAVEYTVIPLDELPEKYSH